MNRMCDERCNECPIILHPNSKQLTVVLNALYLRFGDEAYAIIQAGCPNMTACYRCHVDDFCHMEGCGLLNAAERLNDETEE